METTTGTGLVLGAATGGTPKCAVPGCRNRPLRCAKHCPTHLTRTDLRKLGISRRPDPAVRWVR